MDYVFNAWLGETMKKDYQTKDIKATKTKKVKEVKEGVIFEDNEVYKFIWKGETHGFTKLENAEIALKRTKGE
jgi:hypothetical protein